MNDPLRRLGPEVFLAVVADLGSSSAITAAEAVHPSWRELIQSHDRAVWLPEARRLGLTLLDPHEGSSVKIRDLCRRHQLTRRNWRDASYTARRIYTKSDRVWRIKIDEVAQVLYATRAEGKLLAVDIETSKILSVLPNVEPYAHLEFADGYAMYTAAGHAEVSFQLMKTQQAIDMEERLASAGTEDELQKSAPALARGELKMHHKISPPTLCYASRMRPGTQDRGPTLCTAGDRGSYFWDVQTGRQTAFINTSETTNIGPEHRRGVTYVEFTELYLFIGTAAGLVVYERQSGKILARLGKVPDMGRRGPLTRFVELTENPWLTRRLPRTVTRISGQVLEYGLALQNTEEPPYLTRWPSTPSTHHVKVHCTAHELVVTMGNGFLYVVPAYKRLLGELSASSLSQDAKDDRLSAEACIVHTDGLWSALEPTDDYVILQDVLGLFSLPMSQFRNHSFAQGRGVLKQLGPSHHPAWNHLHDEPSCVQATRDAIYYVHPFIGPAVGEPDGVDVRALSFDPEVARRVRSSEVSG